MLTPGSLVFRKVTFHGGLGLLAEPQVGRHRRGSMAAQQHLDRLLLQLGTLLTTLFRTLPFLGMSHFSLA